ncbi:hypothetical protein [Pseudoalteromonas rubra]|uniref:Uncharacterized protein n=1 Tax=Pseudoalteromonas rubra TaxID=43658 RepID=A0A0U2Z8L2_9GAMM|nr:hypothetical protein [Pseudoalteromonas rubra]ALU44193.1 hypothetical protein AT705_15285 [Pseudoalteromonas rubra]
MKLSNLVLLSIASMAFFYIQLWDESLVTPLYLSLLLLCSLYGVYLKDINMVHISGFIFILNGTTYAIFKVGLINYVTPSDNKLLQGTLIYGFQLLSGIITVLVLIFRVQISRLLSNSKNIELTLFDGLFHWLYMYTSIIYLLGLIENVAWSYFNMKSWTIIYDNFEGLIYISWALCCGALITMMICSTKDAQFRESKTS